MCTMPRKLVPLIVGDTYHVFNRGVDKRQIFSNKADYLRFYQSLYLFNSVDPIVNFTQANAIHRSDTKRQNHQPLVEIKAYALLPNHFHLLATPVIEGGLGEFLRRVSAGYTSYFNEHNERTGALFQGTFKRVHVTSNEQYLYLFAYVNENHAVHGIPRPDEIYASSSLHYQGVMKSRLLAPIEPGVYNLSENQLLAKEIYRKRKQEKNSILLET